MATTRDLQQIVNELAHLLGVLDRELISAGHDFDRAASHAQDVLAGSHSAAAGQVAEALNRGRRSADNARERVERAEKVARRYANETL